MEFRVLGPLEVLDGERVVPLGSAKQRQLLAALLASVNQVVSTDRLADILWGEDQPADAVATLHTYVSRLRGLLEPGRSTGDAGSILLTRAPGYLLRADKEQLDATCFERLVGEARAAAVGGDPDRALEVFDEALALWSGRAFAEFSDADFARAESLRLEELRMVALDERVEVKLSLGRHAELVGELEGNVAADPLRERPRAQLMLALYRCGRHAEALRAYQEYRRYLGDELGIEPSEHLQRLEEDMLHQSPRLDWVQASGHDAATVAPRTDTVVTGSAVAPRDLGIGEHQVPPGIDAPLIGRTDDLDLLRQWLAEALGGSPRVVLVTGAAGIGKSRLVAELIAEARRAAVRPFAGRCLEDSQVPLLPLATMFDALDIDLARYSTPKTESSLPESRAYLAAVSEATRALMAAAADRPVLVVLEDVQWADQTTTQLVAHVAATLAHEAAFRQLPVMLLATARPDGASRHARRLLARLTQEVIGRSLELGGLDELAVFEFLTARTGVRPSTGLLRLVRDATAGNPLEIEMLVARLERARALTIRDDELVADVQEVSALPAEVDVDLVARLEDVSESTRGLVTARALLREGTIASLRIASGLDDDGFDRSLDEATDAGLLVDDGARVDFVDAGARRALMRSASGRRRQRMHAAMARRLIGAGSEARVAAAEIADQLHQAGPEADPDELAVYATAAGDETLALGAWADATRHYEGALRVSSLDSAERGTLEERAAVAAYHNNDPRTAAMHAARAIEVARPIRDLRTWGEAVLLQWRAVKTTTRGGTGADVRALEEFLEVAGEEVPGLRARTHAVLAEHYIDHARFDLARSHTDRARSIANEIDDEAVTARVEFVAGLQHLGSLELEAATAQFRRCEERAQHLHDTLLEAWALSRQPLVSAIRGELAVAAAEAARAAQHDHEHGWWYEYALVTSAWAWILVAQGNLPAAERLVADAVSAHRRARNISASMLWAAIASGRVLRGDTTGAHEAFDEWGREEPGLVIPREMIDVLATGGPPPADAGVGVRSLLWPGAPVDLTSVSLAAFDVELADALGRPEIAVDAPDMLAHGYELGVRFVLGWCLFVPRLVGVGLMLAGRHAEADEWLSRALADARRAGATGEIARTSYDLARARLAAGSTAEVGHLLATAIAEFERLGYAPFLAAARRLAGQPDDAAAGAPSTRVILITDLVDSTPLNRRVGDQRFVELLREHNRILRTRLRQFDGMEFKHTGDGIAAWFLTAGAAIQCALGIQRDLEQFNLAHAEKLHVRIGLSAGEVINNEGDLFGLAVVEAFRVCDEAAEGGILVSDAVPPLVRDGTFGFRSVGEVMLKGFSERRTLLEVTTSPQSGPSGIEPLSVY